MQKIALKACIDADRKASEEGADGQGSFTGTSNVNLAMQMRLKPIGTIALSDTYTTRLFLKNFDQVLSEEFDGVRQDSGDPKEFVDNLVQFYETHSINPQDKTLVFSDGLNADKAVDLEQYVNHANQTAYGIGTNLTNDFPNSPALNLTLKLTAIDGQTVCKLTDDPEKQVGPKPEILELQKRVRKYIGSQTVFTH